MYSLFMLNNQLYIEMKYSINDFGKKALVPNNIYFFITSFIY